MNNKAAEEIRGTRDSHQLRGLKTPRDNRGRELRGRWNPPRDFWVAIATRAEYLSSLPGRGKRWNFIRGEDDFATFVFNVKHALPRRWWRFYEGYEGWGKDDGTQDCFVQSLKGCCDGFELIIRWNVIYSGILYYLVSISCREYRINFFFFFTRIKRGIIS